MTRRVCIAALALAALGRDARAEEKPRGRTSSLSWIRLPGAEACIATQALGRAVEERLGRPVFMSAAQADLSVEGRIEPRRGGGWRAVVTIRDADGKLLGTRQVERADASCDAMSDPVAIVVAVMIDPLSPPAPAPPSVHETVVVKREEVLVPVRVEVPVPAQPPAPPPWRFEGSAAALGSVGLLPGPAVGVAADALIEPHPGIPLTGFGSYWFDATADAERGASAAFSLFLLGGALCPIWAHTPRLHFYACGGGHLGVMRMSPAGFDVTVSAQSRLVWNAALEGRATWIVVAPFALRLGVHGIVPILRDAFVYSRPDRTEVRLFRMAPVAAMVDLGLGITFP